MKKLQGISRRILHHYFVISHNVLRYQYISLYVCVFYIYTGSDLCPVRIYRKYSTRRPFESNNSESRFYLRPKRNISEKVWFDNASLGKNKICDIAKNMAKNAGLEGRKTNHSGRHTAVNMLSKSGLADSTIAKHTGHKNVEGLKPYKSLDLDTQKNISRILMEKAPHAPSTILPWISKRHVRSIPLLTTL